MSDVHDSRFWRELRDRMNAEQAVLKARYEEATRRHRAIMATLLGLPEPAPAAGPPTQRGFALRPLRPKRRNPHV